MESLSPALVMLTLTVDRRLNEVSATVPVQPVTVLPPLSWAVTRTL